MTGSSACPCCGLLTLERRGRHEICKVCFWEDDGPAERDPESWGGGPNGVTLAEARRNFEAFGASEERLVQFVRRPLAEELP
ncbi:CPCC family cysteine-rich protein [Streptomyces cavernicola]|uniref:CPCC family cysteine-rich protein n=1 Tax=Streptomyces cavernicola TaxID=3043613 RepID=A0ABT6SB32_9ACTN|nr:CPCC family cysteine-rich protein [Streptomyces sp. B-S-A6]MDI3405411.1 CPCC family cysteine-rich protein [Streptomyces sp. B-S-A6]